MNKKIKILIAVILTFFLVYFLIKQIKPADFLLIIKNMSFLWLLVAFVFYSVSYVFRSLRFKTLLRNSLRFNKLFDIVTIHNLVNNILPLRIGEFSYVFLLRKHKIRTAEGLATLVIARVFDFISISLIFFIAVLFIPLPNFITKFFLAIGILLFVLIALLIILVFAGRHFIKAIKSFFKFLKLNKNRFVIYFTKKLEDVVHSFKVIKSRKILFSTLLLSFLIWFSLYLMYISLFKGMNIELSYLKIIIGVTFAIFATILPVQGLAGFGTIETVWFLVFFALGVSKELAISSGFVYHIILIIFFVVWGIYGLIKEGLIPFQLKQ